MKRFYCAVCALAITISAGSALALEKMDAKAKSDMTGQAGVTIILDDVTAEASLNQVSYGDDDGLGNGSNTKEGFVTIKGTIMQTIKVAGNMTIDAATATSELTIDNNLGTLNADSTIASGTSFVKIGLPALDIQMAGTNFELYMTDGKGTPAINPNDAKFVTGNSIGRVVLSDVSTKIHPGGSVYIMPH